MNPTRAIANLLLSSTVVFGVLHGSAQAQVIPASNDANTIVTPSGTTFDITGGTTAGTNLFHSFQTFGLNADQIANFRANPAVQNILGRVVGGDASIINGLIRVTGSNANLYLMNPAGIVFGANALLDVTGSFTATTANGIGFGTRWFSAIGSNDYANLIGNPGSFAFTMSQPGSLINAGSLSVNAGQSITLLGGTLINTGTLTAPGGKITVAAVPGEKLVNISQDGSLLHLALPVETGTAVNALPFTPLTLPQLLTGGNLGNATGVVVENGAVKLTSSGVTVPTESGTAIVSNTVDVSGTSGGTVYVLGNKVGLIGATINASGTNSGGTVLIGGDYQGKGSVPNAQQTYVSQDSVIRVDALQAGNGGRAIVWADQATEFYGNISAQGGIQSGSGGFIEVSGKGNLTFQGKVDVRAANGAPGIVLLDPQNIFIVDGNGGADDAALTSDKQILAGDGGTTSYFISEAALESLTGQVTLEATDRIFVNNLSDNRLSLNNASSVTFRTTNFAGGSTFQMEDPNDMIATQTGAIDIRARFIGISNITTNGGDVTLNGGVFLTGDAVISTGTTTQGNISINGQVDGYDWNTYIMAPRSLTIAAGNGNVTLGQGIGNNFSTPSISQLNVSGNNIQFPSFSKSAVSGNVLISAQGEFLLPDNLQVGGNLEIQAQTISPRSPYSSSRLASGQNLNIRTQTGLDLGLLNLETGGNTELRSTNGSIVSSGRIFLPTELQGDVLLEANTDIVLQQTQLQAGGALTLRAGRAVIVQDGSNPAIVQSGGNLTIQGNAAINLEGYRDPDSRIQSGGNLTLISDGAIVANTRLISGGNFSTQQVGGGAANFQQTVPSFNTLISSVGDVNFGNYEGASLKIETQGSINGGNISIVGPNPSLSGADPDVPTLINGSALVLRAGVPMLQNPPSPGSTSAGGTALIATANPTLPGSVRVGTVQTAGVGTGSPVIISAAGDVVTSTIQTRRSSSGSVNSSPVTITAGGSIQTGNISSGGSIVRLSATGDILTDNINTGGFGNVSSVALTAGGNVQISTIDTGAGGIDITAGGAFQAIGSKLNGFSSGGGLVNEPDLIDYLVGQGFDRQQLLDAKVRIPSAQLRVSLISRPSSVPEGQLKSPIVIRYGDQKQTLVNRDYTIGDRSSRLQILGDSQQKFRMGPVFDDNQIYVPANSSNRLQDYNPQNNNFAFTFNKSRQLNYGTAEFPTNASGLVAGIATGEGTDSSLYGALQNRLFNPPIKPGGSDPPINPDGGAPLGDRLTALRQQFQGEDGQVAQRQLTAQAKEAACGATAIAAVPSGDRGAGTGDASSRAIAGAATSAQAGCNSSSDDSQILQLLQEAPGSSQSKQLDVVDLDRLPQRSEAAQHSAPTR